MSLFMLVDGANQQDFVILYAKSTGVFLCNGSFDNVKGAINKWCKKARGSEMILESILKHFKPEGHTYPINTARVVDMWDTTYEDKYGLTLDMWQAEGLKGNKVKKIRPVLLRNRSFEVEEEQEQVVKKTAPKLLKRAVPEERKTRVLSLKRTTPPPLLVHKKKSKLLIGRH